MSKDERYKQALYDAIADVARLPRPKERERILRSGVELACRVAGWRFELVLVEGEKE